MGFAGHAGKRRFYRDTALPVFHVHYRGGYGVRSPIKLYYKHRSMRYFYIKFRNSLRMKARWWLKSARFVVSLLLKHHRPKAAWAVIRGLFYGVTRHWADLVVGGAPV